LRIPETRQEIREEIHDVLGIVEGGYLEEQRRQIQEVRCDGRCRDGAEMNILTRKNVHKRRRRDSATRLTVIRMPKGGALRSSCPSLVCYPSFLAESSG